MQSSTRDFFAHQSGKKKTIGTYNRVPSTPFTNYIIKRFGNAMYTYMTCFFARIRVHTDAKPHSPGLREKARGARRPMSRCRHGAGWEGGANDAEDWNDACPSCCCCCRLRLLRQCAGRPVVRFLGFLGCRRRSDGIALCLEWRAFRIQRRERGGNAV